MRMNPTPMTFGARRDPACRWRASGFPARRRRAATCSAPGAARERRAGPAARLPQDHHGERHLAPASHRARRSRRLGHAGCSPSACSTSAGIDVLAARDDEVFAPGEDAQPPVARRARRGRRCAAIRAQDRLRRRRDRRGSRASPPGRAPRSRRRPRCAARCRATRAPRSVVLRAGDRAARGWPWRRFR